MRKLINFICVLAMILFVPLTLNAQDTPDKDAKNKSIDMGNKHQDPDEQTVAQFKTIADKQSKDLGSKLNLESDDVEEIQESIMDYFDDKWESRVELDQEKGDKEEVRENEEDLADERVELNEEITDELDDNQIAQWNQIKTEWWTSLDNDFFKIMTDTKMNMNKKEMNDNKEHMQNNKMK